MFHAARSIASRIGRALCLAFKYSIAAVLIVAAGVGLFELWLRADPSRLGRPAILAEADLYPYLGIENLFPLNPDGVFEREWGYHKGNILYQHRKTERVAYAGDRFQRVFQLAAGQQRNPDAFRIFVVGSSVAHAGNVPLPERYFSKLQETLKAPYPIQVVAAGRGGVASTEEFVLFALTVLPERPDMVVVLDGHNDFGLSSILGVRPGDPFNASVMYSKHYDLSYNLIRWLIARSYAARVLYHRAIYSDFADNSLFLRDNAEYRAARRDSLVSVYLHNVRSIIDVCRGMDIPVVLAPQPAPDLLLKRYGADIGRMDPARLERIKSQLESLASSPYRDPVLVTQAYEQLVAEIEKSPHLAPHFVNILESVELDHFVDFVHMDAVGQAQMASALATAIQAKLPADWNPSMRDARNPPWP